MDEHRELQRAGKAGGWAAAIAMMVLLAEVVWMVLPFVGYISLHVTMDPFFRFRGRWFQPFFMRSYHPAGAPLALLGIGCFLFGAFQVYRQKLRGGGAVTGGLYRWVRHPQYAALGLVGLGLLLLWPRYYLLLAFVTMCFLYYALARAEERLMLGSCGEGYRSYLESTSAFFPGDRRFLRIPPPGPPTWRGAAGGLARWAFAMVLAFAVAVGISAVTIMNRRVSLVEEQGITALDRLAQHRGAARPGDTVREFFGRDALERSARSRLRTRERLSASLGLLAADPRLRDMLTAVPPPATILAIPVEPERALFEGEAACGEDSRDFLRVYIAAVSDPRDRSLSPRA
ncbi:MAG: hypothetical protein MUE60_08540, partial [Candidatus Eisenbacteria bacterium]|nr:hypothetical protein [Candidatus Eisenbacteria bacterium]